MDTLAICLSGFLFLILFSFLLSFYRDISRSYRYRAAKRKKMLQNTPIENPHKSTLKIPGYYEELANRSKKEEHYSRTHPPII